MSVEEITQAFAEGWQVGEDAKPATMEDISNTARKAPARRLRQSSRMGKLLRAIETRNVSSVKKQLKKDPLLANGTIHSDLLHKSADHRPDLLGYTPLLVAVSTHSYGIDGSSGPGCRGKFGPDIVKLLLAATADVNASTDEGVTPLYHAASLDDTVMVRMLLSANAYPDTTLRDVERGSPMSPLLAAIDNGSMSVVDLLLSAGADVNQEGGHDKYENHVTPLLKSYCSGNVELMGLVLNSESTKGINKITTLIVCREAGVLWQPCPL